MQPKRFRNEVALQPPQSPAARAPTLDRDGESRTGQPDLRLGGNGSSGHLAGEALKSTAKIDVLHVPYKGGAPAV